MPPLGHVFLLSCMIFIAAVATHTPRCLHLPSRRHCCRHWQLLCWCALYCARVSCCHYYYFHWLFITLILRYYYIITIIFRYYARLLFSLYYYYIHYYYYLLLLTRCWPYTLIRYWLRWYCWLLIFNTLIHRYWSLIKFSPLLLFAIGYA